MTNTNSGSLHERSGHLQPVEVVPELELYHDLNSFANLSPDKRREETEQLHRLVISTLVTREDGETGGARVCDGAFAVVEMSATQPLIQRPNAGNKSPQQPGEVCPSCGVLNHNDEMFCAGCGGFIEGSLFGDL